MMIPPIADRKMVCDKTAILEPLTMALVPGFALLMMSEDVAQAVFVVSASFAIADESVAMLISCCWRQMGADTVSQPARLVYRVWNYRQLSGPGDEQGFSSKIAPLTGGMVFREVGQKRPAGMGNVIHACA